MHSSITFHVMLAIPCPCAFKTKDGHDGPLCLVLGYCIIPCGFSHSVHSFAESILKLPTLSTPFPAIIMTRYRKWCSRWPRQVDP